MNAIRGLTGYADKQGVIIDQRFNGGGITPDYLIEWMRRKPLYYYMFRGGDDIATPVNPAPPVKVMIINELNGSAAETGAFMFFQKSGAEQAKSVDPALTNKLVEIAASLISMSPEAREQVI